MPLILALRFAAVYVLLVFGAGFVLGPIRVFLLEPRVGTRAAELIEMPVMLAVIVLAARFGLRRFGAGLAGSGLAAAGILALLALLGAELAVGMALRGLSAAAVFLERDPVSGTAYHLSLALFAALPWLLGRHRSGDR
jgi:hypothetical protein